MKRKSMGKLLGHTWAVFLLVVAPASIAQAASDNFDSYTAGSSLLGTGNTQFTYAGGTPGGNLPGPFTTLTAEADGTAPSAPNVCQFADLDNAGGSVTLQLAAAQAVDLTGEGKTARIRFDFKTTGGPGNRVSMVIRPLYSVDAAGNSQDYISNNHLAGLSDNGIWFLNAGTVLGEPNRYVANTWYHCIIVVTQKGGYYEYTMELQAGGATLGRIINGSAGTTGDSGRTFLTGLGLSLSSNTNEVVLFDDLSIVDITPPVNNGVLWASDNFDTYGGAGTNILGLSNGEFEWINGSTLGTTVTTGHVQVNQSDVRSSPNSMEFFDDALTGSYRGKLTLPSKALFVVPGEPIRIDMDVKAAAGPGGRVSTAFGAQYSANAYGLTEDYIHTDHLFGLADTGNWFLGGGSISGPQQYQGNTWYRMSLTLDRDLNVAGAPYKQKLTLTDLGTNTSLGVASNSGLPSASRGFLTSLLVTGSSNPGETTLIDNLQVRQLVPPLGAGTTSAADNFDSYAGGSSIIGQGNGQINWSNSAPPGSPITTGSATLSSTDAQSSPNALVFFDPTASGSFFGQIQSASAIEMTPDRAVRFRCDFKVTSGYPQNGPGGRASVAFRLFYSINNLGLSQDWIDARHTFGISDNGLWWVDGAAGNGLVSTVGGERYLANTWYHLECIVQRPYNGQHQYRLEIKEIATGASLGVVNVKGLTDANRPWLTGIGIYGSSNQAEITLFDNLAFDVIDGGSTSPCPQDPFANINNDTHVDNDDFAVFQSCAGRAGFAYPGTPASCQCFDRDNDSDVDMDDFGAFQRCYTGSGPLDLACDD